MRSYCRLLVTASLAAALAACGGPPEDEAANGDDTTATEAGAADAGADATPADEEATGEAGDETTDAEATPTPSASASATTATAAPSPAVAAGPPASFTTCAVCHSVQHGQNGIGPSLAHVVGRRAGSVSGANYSPAMQAANLTWTEANLRRYLADPNAVVPGSLMPPPGLTAAQVTEVVNYLKTL